MAFWPRLKLVGPKILFWSFYAEKGFLYEDINIPFFFGNVFAKFLY